MLDSPILEVAVGLTFIYLIFSLFATTLAEYVMEGRQWRGRMLYAKLEQMLGEELVQTFYLDRRVEGLASGRLDVRQPSRWHSILARAGALAPSSRLGISYRDARRIAATMSARRLPSYVPETAFADILLDWLNGTGLPAHLQPGQPGGALIPHGLAAQLEEMNRRIDGDQVALHRELSSWFKQSMDRSTGEFRRLARILMLFVGLLLVLASNADSLRIAKRLYDEPQLAKQLSAGAERLVIQCDGGVDECRQLGSGRDEIAEIAKNSGIPALLGWSSPPSVLSPLGWLLTLLALGLGADFWIGVLKKLLAIKNPKREAASDSRGEALPSADTPAPTSPQPRDPLDLEHEHVKNLRGFQPTRYAESNVHAFWLSQLASLAYSTPSSLSGTKFLQHHGLKETYIDVAGSQAYVFRGGDRCIVAFRGTEKSLDDWLADADIRHKEGPWGLDRSVRVHQGFHDALDALWPALTESLAGVRCPVWMTGHSLGGALALLAGFRMEHCERDLNLTVAGIYTFGQPRVGNPAWVDACSRRLGERVFRYVNSSDIVTVIPPTASGHYEHAGVVRYFDSAGRLHHERTLWERLAEQLAPAFQRVATGDASWRDSVMQHAKQRVADHGIARYIRCLERVEAVRDLWAPPPVAAHTSPQNGVTGQLAVGP